MNAITAKRTRESSGQVCDLIADLPAVPLKEDVDKVDQTDSEDEDDQGVQYRLTVKPSKARRITERQRAGQKALQDFARQSQEKASANSGRKRFDQVSSSSLDSEPDREYQIELSEMAKGKNIIVVLPTDAGSGKTRIAANLLVHCLREEVESRSVGNPKKVAFFLVEKVALCEQQYRALKDSVGGHPIEMFTGDSKGLKKSKSYWDTQFSENAVVLCTAHILLDCLNNAFITMDRIHLLIFDEAHHAKKKHDYAEIMRRYYFTTQKSERPRIFGMTASPVDSKTSDVREFARELERTLDGEIAVLSDKMLMEAMALQVQVEETVRYNTLELPEETKTPLWDSISRLVSRNETFEASLSFTKEASSTLGSWCADRYWQLSITEDETKRLSDRTKAAFVGNTEHVLARLDKARDAVHQVREVVAAHQFNTITPESNDLSSKVKCLHGILVHAFTADDAKRCIVFVDQRHTACLLADLFNQASMAIPGMTAGYMIGHKAGSGHIGNMSLSEQCSTLRKFIDNDINCLFATSVAEEGIDVPECGLCVRFDLYSSVIQYVQSKGRARSKSSRFITMLEDGNMKQARTIKQALRDVTAVQKFCLGQPEDRRLPDETWSEEMERQIERMSYHVYETNAGARLTFPSSLELLSRFAATLHTGDGLNTKAEYHVYRVTTQYIATVHLPQNSPLVSQTGYPQRSKILAKCSAAFEACKKLIAGKHIDEHLQPKFIKQAHKMRNARMGISPNKKAEHDMRVRPNIWSSIGEWTDFYPTTITLNMKSGQERESRPLILLSRKALPQLPSTPLFFGNGRSGVVELLCSQEPLSITAQQAEGLTAFTLKIFDDVFSKKFEATCDQFPYLLAPSARDSHEAPQIDWDTVSLVKENEFLDWNNAPDDFFVDKFVVDLYDGGRKLILKGIDKTKKPSDPTPEGVPEPRCRAYRSVEPTIKEYSNSYFLASRKRREWNDDQPVVRAELLSLRRNLLDEFQVDEEVNKDCFVILEPLNVSPLPLDVVSMALKFPAIIHRIDSVLVALDACEVLELSIPPVLALEAMTKDSDNTDEHDKQQINFQAGMGSNYERLEFLGDSFLKMATTIAIFTRKPKGDECLYHVERMLLICNQNLFNTAVDCKLPEYIRSLAFNRRTWYPDLTLIKGKALKANKRQSLADKTIADVCEALIGAAYLSSKDDKMNMAVKAVTQMARSKHHSMVTFDDYYAAFKVPDWQKANSNANQRRLVQKVEESIGYHFKSAPLLESAFTHPSYTYSGSVPHYQRLEFLGDALLDMAIVEYLYMNFPLADPQWLTEHKMAMVSNHFLGCLCVKLNLHHHLLANYSIFSNEIRDYVIELEAAEEEARKEAEEKGTRMRMDFWRNIKPPPKAYADSVEALVGAMFVDSKFDYSVVEKFFTKYIVPYFEDMSLYDTFANKHPVTILTKMMQRQVGCKAWSVMSKVEVPDAERGMDVATEDDVLSAFIAHEVVITSYVSTSGWSGKMKAAELAIELLESFGGDMEAARKRLGCNCDIRVDDVEIDHGTAV
ncbi:uncharacterized protein B0J16DRAFT_364077 [Fusarium flagelliforme]|uniref:uncharacterized protein n=1 Tax=Fusarium flagelliforme TaxID=2675880 RepID=UPI001E8E6748|nr:uncharacterized protein B0J16DRAFT_364077 [Fusarium flagelliforme]KAH7179182.1 hypothetical protein B0J16DRAFT_364077 [Fusarium flagelliforme]